MLSMSAFIGTTVSSIVAALSFSLPMPRLLPTKSSSGRLKKNHAFNTTGVLLGNFCIPILAMVVFVICFNWFILFFTPVSMYLLHSPLVPLPGPKETLGFATGHMSTHS